MANVLLFDECKLSRVLVKRLLGNSGSWSVECVDAVDDAMEYLRMAPVDVVITDMSYPEDNCFELLQLIRSEFPTTPVVVLTATTSTSLIMKAIQSGATTYMQKDTISLRRLADTLDGVLSAARRVRDREVLLRCMASSENQFVLENDISMIRALQQRIMDSLKMFGIGEVGDEMRISLVLEEAFANAIYHGNLELSSTLKEEENNLFEELAKQRCREEPYCHRRVRLTEHIDREKATIIIEDEGNGFDVSKIPDCCSEEGQGKASGRGMMLMRAFMDEVHYNAKGNQLTLIKWRNRPEPAPQSDGDSEANAEEDATSDEEQMAFHLW
jgi:DNA-binding NarL/FixJ family response regulator